MGSTTPIDEKRVAELKQEQLAKISGQTKVTTERHSIYKIDIDLTPTTPRMIIHSRDEITTQAGGQVNGDSVQTIAVLNPDSPAFQQATPRGIPTGNMVTIGDMLLNAVGFAVDRVADRFAREIAEKEAAENPPEDSN